MNCFVTMSWMSLFAVKHVYKTRMMTFRRYPSSTALFQATTRVGMHDGYSPKMRILLEPLQNSRMERWLTESLLSKVNSITFTNTILRNQGNKWGWKVDWRTFEVLKSTITCVELPRLLVTIFGKPELLSENLWGPFVPFPLSHHLLSNVSSTSYLHLIVHLLF